MKRSIASIVLLLTATTAWAQSYNPEIAYTQVQGKSDVLYLANRDGSHAVALYAVPVKTTAIGVVDFAPGGGRIAIGLGALKVLSYAVGPNGISLTGQVTLDTNFPDAPDFSADGSRVLYTAQNPSTGVKEFRVVSSAGGAAPVSLQWTKPAGEFGISNPRWLYSGAGDTFVFLTSSSAGSVITRHVHLAFLNPDNSLSVTTLFTTDTTPFKAIEDMDTARASNAILLSASYPDAMHIIKYDIDLDTFTDLGGRGYRVHFSGDDAQVLHHSNDGNYLYRFNTLDGTDTRLTGRGRWGHTDWKPQ